MPTQNWGSDSATPLPTVTTRSSRPPRTAAATPISTPKMPLSSVANTAMDAVTGSRLIRSDQMSCPSMSEAPRFPLRRVAEPGQVLRDQRLVPAEAVVLRGHLGRGGPGAGRDRARAAARGVHQEEAHHARRQDGGDGEGEPAGEVGEHVTSFSGRVWPRRPGSRYAAAWRADVSSRAERRQQRVLVLAGEDRLGDLLGVVADVGVLLGDRDDPALVDKGVVQLLERRRVGRRRSRWRRRRARPRSPGPASGAGWRSRRRARRP